MSLSIFWETRFVLWDLTFSNKWRVLAETSFSAKVTVCNPDFTECVLVEWVVSSKRVYYLFLLYMCYTIFRSSRSSVKSDLLTIVDQDARHCSETCLGPSDLFVSSNERKDIFCFVTNESFREEPRDGGWQRQRRAQERDKSVEVGKVPTKGVCPQRIGEFGQDQNEQFKREFYWKIVAKIHRQVKHVQNVGNQRRSCKWLGLWW